MCNEFLIIDVSNIFLKYYYVNKDKTYLDPAIRGFSYFLTLLHKKISKYRNIYFVLDTDKANHDKISDYREYKLGRSDKNEAYKNWKDFLALLCSFHPRKCAVLSNYYRESDDVMAYLAKKLSKRGQVTIFSSDKDFCQLCSNPNIEISDSFKLGEFIKWSHEDIYQKFKNSTRDKDFTRMTTDLRKLTLYRAFKGDKSDNISPPIFRFADKDLKKVMDAYDGEYLDDKNLAFIIINLESKSIKLKIAENFDDILYNFRLMSFDSTDPYNRLKGFTKRVSNKLSQEELFSLCDKYKLGNFRTLLEEI